MLIPLTLGALIAAAAPKGSTGPEAVARHFIEQVSSGHFPAATAPFTARMKQGMPADKVELLWREIQSKHGTFKKIERVAAEPVGDGTAELITCRFEGAAMTFEVYVDAGNHIAGFFLTPAPIIARHFIAELGKSNFDGAEAYLTEKMRKELPASQLAVLWKDLIAQSGEFNQIDRTTAEAANGDWAAVVTVHFANASVVLRVVVDGEAKIDGFYRQ